MNHVKSGGLIVLAALSAVLVLEGCQRQQGPVGAPPAPEVATIIVQTQPVVLTTELPGRTCAYTIAEIRPQVSGLVQKRLFTEGSEVKAGDVLYELDPAPFKAAVDNAEANVNVMRKTADRAPAALAVSEANIDRQKAVLELAKTNRERFEDLLKDKAVSTSERDQAVSGADVAEATLKAVQAQADSDRTAIAAAEAGVKQAEAMLETAKINLGYAKITAPISGRIGMSTVTSGAIVTAYQPTALATIQQLDPIYVNVPQSTAELLRLKGRLANGQVNAEEAGQKTVKLMLEDGTPYALEGTLEFRDITVDPSTGSVTLRAVFPNPKGELLPGVFVRAIVKEGVNTQAIMIPQQAVSRDPRGNALALVVMDGKVVPKPITLDRAIGNQWVVSGGLAAGDHVIVEGMARPGSPVREVPAGGAKEQAPKTGNAAQPAAASN